MAIKALDHNVNIIALEKNGRRYAMCCAWVTQVAADKLAGIAIHTDGGSSLHISDLGM